MDDKTTREIVLELAHDLEKLGKDPGAQIELTPYFVRVINRVLESAARIAESHAKVCLIKEPRGERCCEVIAEAIREVKSEVKSVPE